MSAQHTPGPWRYELDGPQTDDMRHAVLAEVNDLWVAACYRSGTTAKRENSAEAEQEVEANARLIAAAPDLLAALAALHNNMRAQDVENDADRPTEDEYRQCMRNAAAAIAKATGSPA